MTTFFSPCTRHFSVFFADLPYQEDLALFPSPSIPISLGSSFISCFLYHLDADSSQIYVSSPAVNSWTLNCISNCYISLWMSGWFPKLNFCSPSTSETPDFPAAFPPFFPVDGNFIIQDAQVKTLELSLMLLFLSHLQPVGQQSDLLHLQTML